MDDLSFVDPGGASPADTDGQSLNVRDSPILRLFVLQVVVWNLVLLAGSLGLLLIHFEGDWGRGAPLVAAASILALYGAYRWPRGEERAVDAS